LKQAETTNRNLYLDPIPAYELVAKMNPVRIIGVSTQNGLTVARTITGGTVPISNLNFSRLSVR
jgi:hypothetical protein